MMKLLFPSMRLWPVGGETGTLKRRIKTVCQVIHAFDTCFAHYPEEACDLIEFFIYGPLADPNSAEKAIIEDIRDIIINGMKTDIGFKYSLKHKLKILMREDGFIEDIFQLDRNQYLKTPIEKLQLMKMRFLEE